MLSLTLAALVLLQDPPPKPPPTPEKRDAPAAQPKPDAKPLVPGAIPDAADPEARLLWQSLCQHALVPTPGVTRAPVTAFDLVIDARVNSSANQTNEDQKLRYRFQMPGNLRFATQNEREYVRGPGGDFLLDPKRGEGGEKIPIPKIGREFAEDRRQLDEALDLSHNFVALCDPAALRLADLKLASTDTQLLPEALRAEAATLSWIEIRTPDFRLPHEAPAIVRVLLGLQRADGLPHLCIVGPDVQVPAAPRRTLIHVKQYRQKDGRMVPWYLALYPENTKAPGFEPLPALQISLRNASSLQPSFPPETFLP